MNVPDKPLLIIKSNLELSPHEAERLHATLVAQKRAGVVVVPCYCDVVYLSDGDGATPTRGES